MRVFTIMAFFAAVTVACGGTDNASVDNGPTDKVETAVVATDAEADTAADAGMEGPPTFQTTLMVPSDREINNEGDVLLEVRTVEGALDTVWIAESSGYSEVDDFALDQVLTSGLAIKFGWGDPPYRLMAFVRIPKDPGGGARYSEDGTLVENTPMTLLVTIPAESELNNEGDVVFEVRLVEKLVDTAWVVQTSGYPEVDEFAMKHLMSLKESGHFFSPDSDEQTFQLRLVVRQPSGKESE